MFLSSQDAVTAQLELCYLNAIGLCLQHRILICMPIAVVFTFFETMDELRSVLTQEDIEKFEKSWEIFDPLKSGYISLWKLPSLMERCKIFV